MVNVGPRRATPASDGSLKRMHTQKCKGGEEKEGREERKGGVIGRGVGRRVLEGAEK